MDKQKREQEREEAFARRQMYDACIRAGMSQDAAKIHVYKKMGKGRIAGMAAYVKPGCSWKIIDPDRDLRSARMIQAGIYW